VQLRIIPLDEFSIMPNLLRGRRRRHKNNTPSRSWCLF
jgi:hypothetical protein